MSKGIGVKGLGALTVTLAFLGCRVTDIPVWESARIATDGPFEVEKVRDVAYCDARCFPPYRHKLDLFLPKGAKNCPVVVLVHGGAWVTGDNRCCGLYSGVGEFLARNGIAAVLPNYRLSPGVKHPEHIKDVARAVAWTREHIAEHGGDPEKLFLVGHSAGGHLVALLATDESYLKAEGLKIDDIKGVIAVSGVYHIPPGNTEYTLGGNSPGAFHWRQVGPMRHDGPPEPKKPPTFSGIPMSLDPYWPAFGNDPSKREDASPIKHVRPGLPPFLLLSAQDDLPTLPGMATEFHDSLQAHGVASQLIKVEGRNHSSIFFRAVESEDPAARAMLGFIRGHADAKRRTIDSRNESF